MYNDQSAQSSGRRRSGYTGRGTTVIVHPHESIDSAINRFRRVYLEEVRPYIREFFEPDRQRRISKREKLRRRKMLKQKMELDANATLR